MYVSLLITATGEAEYQNEASLLVSRDSLRRLRRANSRTPTGRKSAKPCSQASLKSQDLRGVVRQGVLHCNRRQRRTTRIRYQALVPPVLDELQGLFVGRLDALHGSSKNESLLSVCGEIMTRQMTPVVATLKTWLSGGVFNMECVFQLGEEAISIPALTADFRFPGKQLPEFTHIYTERGLYTS